MTQDLFINLTTYVYLASLVLGIAMAFTGSIDAIMIACLNFIPIVNIVLLVFMIVLWADSLEDYGELDIHSNNGWSL